MHSFYIEAALQQTEQAINNQTMDRRTDKSHASVLAAVTSAVMFLELSINCYYSDQFLPFARTKFAKALRAAWDEGVDRLGLLSKYQLALTLANAAPFETGRDPYQSVACLVDLRNRLTHPKQAFGLRGEDQLESLLRGRFRFRSTELYQGFFPDQCFSPDCAIWAIRSSVIFVDEFLRKLPTYAQQNTGELVRTKSWLHDLSELQGKADAAQLPYKLKGMS